MLLPNKNGQWSMRDDENKMKLKEEEEKTKNKQACTHASRKLVSKQVFLLFIE